MSNKLNKKRRYLKKYQEDVDKIGYCISHYSEKLFNFYDTNYDGKFDWQLENITEVERLSYEDGINKETFKFKQKVP